jgi:glycosyltransferase involved in cell wall biosynthesis
MKLIIQIPCFNEEATLPLTIAGLPKKIAGIDTIETLVVNDGSTDNTEKIAGDLKVDHIITIPKRHGLAHAFKTGLDAAVNLGADIIVNTDGDNQYNGEDVALLVAPILQKKARIVVGCRDMSKIRHFSFIKKLLQRIGSQFVRKFSNTKVLDVTSGFRAYSRDAAMRINIFSDYTYTLESILQAGRNNIPIECITIRTNPKLRESRLMKSMFGYVARSVATILRIYIMYEPLKSFFVLGLLPLGAGLLLILRFLIDHFTRIHGGHVQSLIVAAVLILAGFGTIMIGLLGDIISANRKIGEEILYRLKKKQ